MLDELIGEIDELMGKDICDSLISLYEENKEREEPSRDGFDFGDHSSASTINVRPQYRDSRQLQFLSPIFEHTHEAVQTVIDNAAKLWYNHIFSVFEDLAGKDTNMDQDFLQFCMNGLPPWEIKAEILMVKYYKEQKHGYHSFHVDQPLSTPETPESRRFMSLIAYLNDVEEGGETLFWYGQKIKPEKGKVLVFPSVFPFIHKGNIPISNDKYILQIFLNNSEPHHILLRNFNMIRNRVIELENKYEPRDPEYTGTGQSKIGASGLPEQQKYSQIGDW